MNQEALFCGLFAHIGHFLGTGFDRRAATENNG